MPLNSVSDATQANLDAAATSANIAEEQKRAAQANKDAAVANLEAAKADASRLELLKANLPTALDTKKYQTEKPTAPVLNATLARLTFEQAEVLANNISKEIQEILPKITANKGKATFIADGSKARALLAVEQATREGMLSVEKGLTGLVDNLRDKIDNQAVSSSPVTAFLPLFPPGGLLFISSIIENIISYATILKTQWGFTTVSVAANAESILTTLIQSKLIGNVTLLDPESILAMPDGASAIAKSLLSIRSAIDAARKAVSDAAEWSAEKRKLNGITDGNDAGTNATQPDTAQSADEVDHLASLVASTADEANKFLTALFAIDAQGNTLFDSAQRGEALREALGLNESLYTLIVKVVASEADTVVSDRLFSGFKLYAGNTTVAQWKLIDCRGVIRSAGSKMATTKFHKIQMPSND